MGTKNSGAVRGRNATQAIPPKHSPSDATADYAALLAAKRAKDEAQKTADAVAKEKDAALTKATEAIEKEFKARDAEADKALTAATEAYEQCKEMCGLD